MLILIFYTVMLLRQLTEIDSTKQDRKKNDRQRKGSQE